MTPSEQAELGLPPTPRLVRCSPTKLATWVDCPRRFRFAYIDRPAPKKGPPWAHLSYGTSAHNALRAWWDLPVEGRIPDCAAALVRDNWQPEGYRDDEQSQRWLDSTVTFVKAYLERLDAAIEPRGIERTVGMRTPVLAFSGRVDRIDERGDELVIVDYKMGRSVPSDTDARASMPLALYAEAAQRTLRKPCRRVELHHLPSGTAAAWEHSDQSIERHMSRADGIGDEVRQALVQVDGVKDGDEAFPTKPGVMCGWCDYRQHCPEGQAAAPARQPWDGLDEGPTVS